jgi:hypothetical protein
VVAVALTRPTQPTQLTRPLVAPPSTGSVEEVAGPARLAALQGLARLPMSGTPSAYEDFKRLIYR